MRSLRVSCFLLLSASVIAQSSTAPRSKIVSPASIPERTFQHVQPARLGPSGHKIGRPQSSGLSFAPAVTYGSGGDGAWQVAIADVNNDGIPDLVVANTCNVNDCTTTGLVGVLIGNGDGTFQKAITYNSGGYQALSVAVADLNGDGKPDIVVANICDTYSDCMTGAGPGNVGVLLGNGDGTFQPAVMYGSGAYYAYAVVVGDVNNDGKLDIVVANSCGSGNCATDDGAVGVLLGNGNGTFQTSMTYDSGGYENWSVAVADVNGDGKLDVLVTNTCPSSNECAPLVDGTVGVLLGNGDGTFQKAMTYDSGVPVPVCVAVSDLNADGNPDLIVSGSSVVSVLLGGGFGTFHRAVTYPSGGSSTGSRNAGICGDRLVNVARL